MNENDRNIMINLIEKIKNDILSTRNTILKNANVELLSLYFRIGKSINENANYGNHFINQLSTSLKEEFPNTKGYSPRNLSRMKKFYEEYCDLEILPTPLAKLPWALNCLLIDKVKNKKERLCYAEKCIENNWSFVIMQHQIESNLYERQADNKRKLTNFNNSISSLNKEYAQNMIKDPYIFELAGLGEIMTETDIEKRMLEKIKNVLLEFGKGFSFVANQYRIPTENNDYYIDLLFYNIELRCYVVVELKNTDFNPAYIGQLQFYVTAIDETIKKNKDNKTIGLLLCKQKDELSVKWALKPINVPIGVASYEIRRCFPSKEQFKNILK